MVAEKFKETLTVGSTLEECWSILTDVDRIAEWVSVVGSVTEVEHLAKYSAVLEDRLGPFSMKADLDVVVTDLQPQKSISIRADGEDRQIGSRITVDATLAIIGVRSIHIGFGHAVALQNTLPGTLLELDVCFGQHRCAA